MLLRSAGEKHKQTLILTKLFLDLYLPFEDIEEPFSIQGSV